MLLILSFVFVRTFQRRQREVKTTLDAVMIVEKVREISRSLPFDFYLHCMFVVYFVFDCWFCFPYLTF